MVNVLDEKPDDVYSLDERENQTLQSLVNDVEKIVVQGEPKALVELELKKKRIFEAESHRAKSRVLFIVSNPKYLEKTAVEDTFGHLHEVFDEVHILHLTDFQKKKSTQRINKKTWVYYASSKTLLMRVRTGLKIIKRELTFTDGFRPDLIVALDPYESSQVAIEASDLYDRPWQMHILEVGVLSKNPGRELSKKEKWQQKIAFSTIPSAESIRFAGEHIETIVTSNYKQLPEDAAVLPHFYNVSKLLQDTAVYKDADAFPQFAFTLLYVGVLDATSQFHIALDAARHLLKTPTVGMVVIGIGPMKDHFMERAKLLGIERQLVFLGERTDYLEELASADLLLLPETTDDQDQLMIEAAALGTPVIATTNELRQSLFEDKVSALLVPERDISAMSAAIKKFMNENAVRTQLAINARKTVTERIIEDPKIYRIAYRNSIETVLHRESQELERKAVAEQIQAAQEAASRKQDRYRDIDGKSYKLPKEASLYDSD